MTKEIRKMSDQELKAAADAGEITASALVVEQDRRAAAAAPPEPVLEGWTLDRVMLRPGAALEALHYYRRRVQELLETTNRYLERARAAEAIIAAKCEGATAHITTLGLKLLADGQRADVFPPNVTHEYMRPLFLMAAPMDAPAVRDHDGIPIEPTDAMIEAGQEEIANRRAHGCGIYAADIWSAMVAAMDAGERASTLAPTLPAAWANCSMSRGTTRVIFTFETEERMSVALAALGEAAGWNNDDQSRDTECPGLAEPQPCGLADPSYRDCPNMKEAGGGMEGERYRCAVCGKSYFLDYEEMK